MNTRYAKAFAVLMTWIATLVLVNPGCGQTDFPAPMPSASASTVTLELPSKATVGIVSRDPFSGLQADKRREAIAKGKAAQKSSPVYPYSMQTDSLSKSRGGGYSGSPHAFAMTTAGPIYPVGLNVTDWYVDPANSTTHASDANDCQTAVTPCLTWNEIPIHRWGTYFPVLGSGTAFFQVNVHILSSWDANTTTDFINVQPLAGFLEFVGPTGTAQQVATGTMTVTAAKNPATRTLLTVTLATGVARGLIVHNNTQDSYAWPITNTTGNTWTMSQPININDFSAPEVTWSTGDSFTVYKLASMVPGFMWGPITIFASLVDMGDYGFQVFGTYAAEFTNGCVVGSAEGDVLYPFAPFGMSFNDDYFPDDSVLSVPIMGNPFSIVGGLWTGANNFQGAMTVTKDFVSGGTGGLVPRAGSSISQVWLVPSGILAQESLNINGYVTGSGAISIAGNGIVRLPLGSTTAVDNLLSSATNPVLINGKATAFSVNVTGTTPTYCAAINLTPANLDAATSATCASTGFGGQAFNPGGGSMMKLLTVN